jgi:predicted nucleotidyltransferase
MNTSELLEAIQVIHGLVAISLFGSYGSEYWIKDRSDIDLMVVVDRNTSYLDTLNIEDKLLPALQKYYNYNKVHLTFILFKDFSSKYARIAIDSDTVFVMNDNDWFDFKHYVLKHIRNNENLERTLKLDEQYSYFGGIIDESLL